MGGRNHVVNEEKYKVLEGEHFREHPIYEGYFVSNMGRVRLPKSNFSKKYPGRISMGSRIRRNGNKEVYEHVIHIRCKKKEYTRKIHRLVAEAWFPLPTETGLVVDHIDGNPENNHVSNLRWMDVCENVRQGHLRRKINKK